MAAALEMQVEDAVTDANKSLSPAMPHRLDGGNYIGSGELAWASCDKASRDGASQLPVPVRGAHTQSDCSRRE